MFDLFNVDVAKDYNICTVTARVIILHGMSSVKLLEGKVQEFEQPLRASQ